MRFMHWNYWELKATPSSIVEAALERLEKHAKRRSKE
jgi:hypothetical protein